MLTKRYSCLVTFTANIYLAFPALCGYAQEAHCGNVLILEHVYLRKQKQNIRLIEKYRRTLLNYKEVKDKYISHGTKRTYKLTCK